MVLNQINNDNTLINIQNLVKKYTKAFNDYYK